jgi:hypothetical protein
MARRYLNLDGTQPCFKSKALRQIFNAESYTGAATVLAWSGLTGAFNGPACGITALAAGLGTLVASQAFFRFTQRQTLQMVFGDYAKKCFDRKPTANTAPTTPANLSRATVVASAYKRGGGNLALIAGLALTTNTMMTTLGIGSPVLALLATVPTILGVTGVFNMLQTAHRFTKVTKQDWVLHDNPPPRAVKVARAAAAPSGVPGIG